MHKQVRGKKRLETVQLDMLVLLTGIVIEYSIVLAAVANAMESARDLTVPGHVFVVEIETSAPGVRLLKDVGLIVRDDLSRVAVDDDRTAVANAIARFPAAAPGRYAFVQLVDFRPGRTFDLLVYLRTLTQDRLADSAYQAALQAGFRVRVYPIKAAAELKNAGEDSAMYRWQTVAPSDGFRVVIPLNPLFSG